VPHNSALESIHQMLHQQRRKIGAANVIQQTSSLSQSTENVGPYFGPVYVFQVHVILGRGLIAVCRQQRRNDEKVDNIRLLVGLCQNIRRLRENTWQF